MEDLFSDELHFDNKLFLTVDKKDYQSLLNVSSSDPNYNKIGFISDGSGIITRGKLYVNSPYWISVVDVLPTTQEPNTIYFVKE